MRMMSIETPIFRAIARDPRRMNKAIEQIVARLVEANDHGFNAQYEKWVVFIQRIEAQSSALSATDPDRATARNFNSNLVAACHDSGIRFPLVWLATQRRFIEQSRAMPEGFAAEILREEYPNATNIDCSYILDHVREWHSTQECDDCGSLEIYGRMHREARTGNMICTSCCDDHYVHSDYYDAYVHADNVRDAYDANGNSVTIDENDRDFFYNDETEEYEHRSTRDRGVIRDYHASKNSFAPILDAWVQTNNRLLGVELEVEVTSGDRNDAAKKIHDKVNDGQFGKRVFFERDGSLSNGFEIITQPMSLPMVRETFDFLKHPSLTRNLRSHRTTTCGLHVHVSRTGLTNVQIARAVVFINDPRNDTFITAIARRYNTGFCNVRDKEIETAHLPGDRYEAVNLTGRNTIEFRIFRGSLKFEAVVAAAEFVHALLKFCGVIEQTAYQLNARDFLAWCAIALPDETATMREYVAARNSGLFQVLENVA